MDLLKTVEIFGFSGKLGTGKDFLANALNNMLPAVPTLFLALADQLKIEAIVKGGLSRDKVYGKKDEETRKVLQELGTSQGRDKYGEDIWINYLTEWMIQHVNRGIRRFFITDVRFSNEVEFINSVGGYLFRIRASKRNDLRLTKELELQGILEDNPDFMMRKEKLASHISETALDNHQFNHTIFNDLEYDSISTFRQFVFSLYPPILKKTNTSLKIRKTYFVDLDDTICECLKYYRDVENKVTKYLGLTKEEFITINNLVNNNWEKEPFYRDSFAVGLLNVAKSVISLNLPLSDEENIYKLGMSVHEYNYEPIEGAVRAVKLLKSKGKVVIFTIGNRADQLRKLIMLGLHMIVMLLKHQI